MKDFLDSQLWAAIVGAALALSGTFMAQHAAHKKQVSEQKQLALEELIVAVKREHAVELKKCESFRNYKYQRLFANYLAVNTKRGATIVSGISTLEVHQREAQETLHAFNRAIEQERYARSEILRYTSRLTFLFPAKADSIQEAVKAALLSAEGSSDVSGEFKDFAASEAFQEQSREQFTALSKELDRKFEKFQEYVTALAGEG